MIDAKQTNGSLRLDKNSNLSEQKLTSRRVEREVFEWVKFFSEVIYGCLMTIVYIVMEVVELVVPKRSKSLSGQHVLVTGAGRGLGREICVRLVREGVTMTCVDVSLKTAEETAEICNKLRPGSAKAVHCDISDRQAVNRLAKELPVVDVLINNAGIVSSAGILAVSDDHIDRMMHVNIISHFWTIRAFLPGMISRGRGHIVGVASAAAFTAAANIAPYTATKYAVTGSIFKSMMASLREEFRHFHPEIKATTVHPFFITPPSSSVEHWDKTSKLPDVTAEQVADMTVRGIKKDKVTVTIPHHLYYLLHLLHLLPTAAGEIWRDLFYAKIDSIDKKAKGK